MSKGRNGKGLPPTNKFPTLLQTDHALRGHKSFMFFTICLFISPDFDGHRAPKMEP